MTSDIDVTCQQWPTLTHSAWHSRIRSRWRLEISRICEQSCYVPNDLPIAPTFEIFTSSAEESNSKLLAGNRCVSWARCLKNECVGGRALLPRTPLKELTALPKSPSWIWRGRFATEKGKGKEMWKNWGERKEGEGKEK